MVLKKQAFLHINTIPVMNSKRGYLCLENKVMMKRSIMKKNFGSDISL
jgi:hypothetical protein